MRNFFFLLSLILLSCPVFAQVTIGGMTFDNVDPGPDFTEAAREVQTWSPPAPTSTEKQAGMLSFLTPDPGNLRPYLAPKPEQHVSSLSAQVALGEEHALWIGLWTLDDLKGLQAQFEAAGAPFAGDVWSINFWPQRKGGYKTREWHFVPELLLPISDGKVMKPAAGSTLAPVAFDIDKNETFGLWISIKTQTDAKPGKYTCKLSIQADGKKALTLPVNIEVLPFTLPQPEGKSWLLYADISRFRSFPEAVGRQELVDFHDHGITGLVELPLGAADLGQIKDGKVRFDASEYKRIAAMARDVGIYGPHVVNCWYDDPVRDIIAPGANLEVAWPKAQRDALSLVAKAAVEATKDEPSTWYWYGIDEPSAKNIHAMEQYQSWHNGGAKTYATFYEFEFLAQASKYLTAPCFSGGLLYNQAQVERAYEACKETGSEFWWYGTGCYIWQDEAMHPNRFGCGFAFWKSKAIGQVTWTFQRVHADPWNDFDGVDVNSWEPKDQCTGYPWLTRPNDMSSYQGAIPSLAWESIREGINDYKYMELLRTEVEKGLASSSEAVRTEAKRAQGVFKALDEAIPYNDQVGAAGFDCIKMNQVRRLVASTVLALQNAGTAKAGQVTRKIPQSIMQVTLDTPRPEISTPVPVMGIPQTDSVPVIDGKLDDACWKSAANTSGFSDVNSAKPIKVAGTTGRICYDDEAIYVAFDCSEPQMDKLVAKCEGRDPQGVWLEDGIEFFINPSGNRATEQYAHFIINTNGALYDEVGMKADWDLDIQWKVNKRGDGYGIELALPWSELERTGLPRNQFMTLNFCRNRFAGTGDSSWHSAWSPTFEGFHIPKRFGLGILQEQGINICSIQMPTLWGPQDIEVELFNASSQVADAFVKTATSIARTKLVAGQTKMVKLPINLTQVGLHAITLNWGAGDKVDGTADFTINVPAPIQLSSGHWFRAAGDNVEVTTHLALAPEVAKDCSLRISMRGNETSVTQSVPLKSTSVLSIPVPAQTGKVIVRATLVGKDGKRIGDPMRATLFLLDVN